MTLAVLLFVWLCFAWVIALVEHGERPWSSLLALFGQGAMARTLAPYRDRSKTVYVALLPLRVVWLLAVYGDYVWWYALTHHEGTPALGWPCHWQRLFIDEWNQTWRGQP